MTGLDKSQILEVELELTGTCNLACPLCIRDMPEAQHLLTKNIRPVADWIAQLDQYTNLQSVHLAGSISEPTMYKDFIPLIKYLVARNVEVLVFTNANTHTPAWWKEVGEVLQPTDSVYFTICGSTQELHGKYRIGSNLQQVLNHATALRESGRKTDWLQLIKFEYNVADLESDAMKAIEAQFSNTVTINCKPYQERFNIIKDTTTDIKMIGALGEKYNTIKTSVMKRHDSGAKCNMSCKSFETKFLSIDQFGKEFPCFLYRMYKKTPFDHTDYSEIHKFEYTFCYECESITTNLIERNGMETLA